MTADGRWTPTRFTIVAAMACIVVALALIIREALVDRGPSSLIIQAAMGLVGFAFTALGVDRATRATPPASPRDSTSSPSLPASSSSPSSPPGPSDE